MEREDEGTVKVSEQVPLYRQDGGEEAGEGEGDDGAEDEREDGEAAHHRVPLHSQLAHRQIVDHCSYLIESDLAFLGTTYFEGQLMTRLEQWWVERKSIWAENVLEGFRGKALNSTHPR